MPLPFDASQAAIGVGGVVLEVSGLWSFFPAMADEKPVASVVCTHPTAQAQTREVAVMQCPDCDTDPACETCGGFGMVALIPDPDDPEHPQVVKVDARGLTKEEALGMGLETVSALPASEFEKTVNRSFFQSFAAYRDAIRLPGTKSS